MNEARTLGHMTVLKVVVETDGEYHYATSPDLPGLDLTNNDLNALARDIPRAAELLYRLNRGVNVVAKLCSDVQTFPAPAVRPDTLAVEYVPDDMDDARREVATL